MQNKENNNQDRDVSLIVTEDGSHSLFHSVLNETYHSRHGAIIEAKHVFISAGLEHALLHNNRLNLLEVGFGTGLNAWLTLETIHHRAAHIAYTSLEAFPLNSEVYEQLNFTTSSTEEMRSYFSKIHTCKWNEEISITESFLLMKVNQTLQHFSTYQKFDLIYYDAFGPPVQPEMWTQSVFEKLFDRMADGGVLVTYCAKGQVRRNMIAAGFEVERLPGPPGKREMLRATKKKIE